MTTQSLEMNTLAPDFALPAHTGEQIRLSDYQGRQQVVLFFVRTASCWQCRSHVEQLARMYPEFQRHNTEVLVIIHSDVAGAAAYADKLKVPFPVLADEEHQVYELYGLNRIFLLNTRTGSVVVDRVGRVRYQRSAINPGAWLKESLALRDEVATLTAEASAPA